MKRFFIAKDANVPIVISDGQGMVYAEFSETNSGENVFLLDKKNEKIQYKISRKMENNQITYTLFQEENYVGTTTPILAATTQSFTISVPKYGSNLTISFKNKTDFEISREGMTFALFTMTSENRGNLDIAKGERRNFSFAIAALYILWSERCENILIQQNKENIPDTSDQPVRRKKSRSRSTEKSKDYRLVDKNSKAERKPIEKTKSINNTQVTKLVIPRKSLNRDESDGLEDLLNAEESSGNEDEENRRKPVRRRSSRTPRAPLSARTSIPLRSTSTKSPRSSSNNLIGQKTESSNSVLNALLQKKRESSSTVEVMN
jgi:hypothetical protein